MPDSRPPELSVKVNEEMIVTENVGIDARKDFGSEQLPIDVTENPWDVSTSPESPPPSGQVAGDGLAVASGDSGTSNE